MFLLNGITKLEMRSRYFTFRLLGGIFDVVRR